MNVENIKFKAKRLDNGEWVVGSFVVMKIPALSKTTIGIVAAGGATLHEVDPSTVCQFTGLKDGEGKEIWEGDILLNVANDGPDGIVVFKYGAFSLLAKNGRDYCIALTYLLSVKDSLGRFKVIGNKFDRKEGEK